MHIIDFQNLSTLPIHFRKRLVALKKVFLEYIFLEEIEHIDEVQQLIIDINTFCSINHVVGYHYTKAIPDEIKKDGLLSQTGDEWRKKFLKEHINKFNKNDQNSIIEKYQDYWDVEDRHARDNRIFFNFTLNGLEMRESQGIMNYYGGEQIFACFLQNEQILSTLKNIGEFIIIKCILNTSNIHTDIEYPWGKIAMSAFHRSINPEAICIDQDGWQSESVPSKDIEIITPK